MLQIKILIDINDRMDTYFITNGDEDVFKKEYDLINGATSFQMIFHRIKNDCDNFLVFQTLFIMSRVRRQRRIQYSPNYAQNLNIMLCFWFTGMTSRNCLLRPSFVGFDTFYSSLVRPCLQPDNQSF